MQPTPEPTPSELDAGPIEVIIVNDFASITGGSAMVALAEAAGLARRGHRVTLIAGQGAPPAELLEAGVTVRLTEQLSTLEDPVRVRAAGRGVWNRAAAALVWEVIEAADSDRAVIHLHGIIKVLSGSVARAAARSGLATIATLHDYFAACPNGGFFNYQTEEVCPLTPLSARCIATNCDARAYSHKLWRVGRTAVQGRFGLMPAGVQTFIVPTRSAADVMRPYLPSGAPVHILSNPVVTTQLAPADVASGAAFVLVGRLARDKGGTLFAEAAREANVPAVLVGAGDQAGQIAAANPAAYITGWLAPGRVRKIVRGARAAVNASLGSIETHGLSVLEAAADGVPSIVPAPSVFAETVEDGVTGLSFRRGDGDDLADKLALLHREPELAKRLGLAAYERFWSQPPDLDTHLDRLEAIYRSALGSRPAPSAPVRAPAL